MADLWRRYRWFVVSVSVVLVIGAFGFADERPVADSDSALLGIWGTHYQQTSITLIINRDHTAHFLLIDQGRSIGTSKWTPAPNGLIVESLPRIRIWRDANDRRVRAQMEPLPPEMTNDSMQRFPLSFYMQKSSQNEELMKRFSQRPIPADWMADEPPRTFENDAGRPRKFPR